MDLPGKRNKMDRLWAMTVFVRVAECRSFSRAAESLDLANATVTACVRNLEQHLQVTLIDRDTRRLHLTEEGTLFLERARAVLRSVEDAEAEVRTRVGGLQGNLTIETPIAFGNAILCPALPKFAADYPDISTAVTLTNQRHNLIEKAIDVAIRMDRVEDDDLIARPIYEARYQMCCTPEMAQRLPADPNDLDPGVCLGLLNEERRSPSAWKLQRNEQALTIQPRGPLLFNSTDALVNAAVQGAGVIHALDIFVTRELQSGSLVSVYPDWDTEHRTFYAVTTKVRNGSAKVRAFNDFLSEVIAAKRPPKTNRPVAVRAIGKR